MIDCLPGVPKPGKNPLRSTATVILLDMAAVIHMVKPGTKTVTFKDYCHMNLLPFIMSQLSPTVGTIHGVWNSYIKGKASIKTFSRTKRARGNFR